MTIRTQPPAAFGAAIAARRRPRRERAARHRSCAKHYRAPPHSPRFLVSPATRWHRLWRRRGRCHKVRRNKPAVVLQAPRSPCALATASPSHPLTTPTHLHAHPLLLLRAKRPHRIKDDPSPAPPRSKHGTGSSSPASRDPRRRRRRGCSHPRSTPAPAAPRASPPAAACAAARGSATGAGAGCAGRPSAGVGVRGVGGDALFSGDLHLYSSFVIVSWNDF